MTSSVSSSASDWPPMMTKPIAWLVPEPTPRETMQRDHAGDERERRHQDRPQPIAAGLDDRPRASTRPVSLQLVGVVDLQDRVLLHDAEQHEQAERREDVQRLPEDDDRQQRERQRQRQRQQNRDRVQPRLELRRQNQVHEDERQQRTRARSSAPARPSSRDRPVKRAAVVAARRSAAGTRRASRSAPPPATRPAAGWRRPSPAAAAPSRLMSDGADAGREVRDVVERHAAEPRRGHRQRRRSPLRCCGSAARARRCTSYCSPPSL